MELKDFVRDTLVQIVDGVVEARQNLIQKNADVNPVGGNFDPHSLNGKQWSREKGVTELVHFGVALTQEDAKGTKGGIGVFLGGHGLGSQGQSEASSSSLSLKSEIRRTAKKNPGNPGENPKSPNPNPKSPNPGDTILISSYSLAFCRMVSFVELARAWPQVA